MHLQISHQLELGDPTEALFENRSFDLKLVIVGGVLVLASAATLEVRAFWLNAMWRRTQNLMNARPSEFCLVLVKTGFDLLSFENEGGKYGLSASVVVRWKARQTIAPVDEFLDFQLHKPLLHGGLAGHHGDTEARKDAKQSLRNPKKLSVSPW